MKTKLLLLGGLLVLSSASTRAQIPITTNTLAPVVGPYDQYYLPGPVSEATQAIAPSYGYPSVYSGDNDAYTYLAGNQTSKGQTFTTGSNPEGYTISSVTLQHINWGTNYLNNGTFMNIPTGSTFLFRFGTMSGTTITSSLLSTNAAYNGAPLNMAGGSGTGIYFTFNLSGAGIGTLAPNTQYFFELASSGTPYFELQNTGTNVASPPFPALYTNGTAFYGDTDANLDQSGTVSVPPYGGEFAFDVGLQAVGAPIVVATANPPNAQVGQLFTVTATVTPGSGTVTNVSVNLSAIGGSSAARLVLSATANVYTNTFTVPSGAPLGAENLAVTAKDTTPETGIYGIVFTVVPNGLVWNGGSSSDNNWSDGANWQGGLAPSLTGNNIVLAGATRLAPNLNNNYSITGLIFSNTAGAFDIGSSVGDTLTIGSGGIVNNSANPEVLNVPVVMASAQTFNVAAGSLTLNTNVTGGFALATTGAGTVKFTGVGTNSVGNLQVTGSAQLNITAGTVNATDSSGNLTTVDSNATLVVSGGTLNILGSSAGGWFAIGQTTGATGTVVVAGGTVNVSDEYGTELGNVLNGSGAGVLTINSGTFINNDSFGVGFMLGETGSAGGTVNLNGGALIVNQIIAHNAGGNFFFNGGALEPLASSATFWTDAGTVTASIRNGGGAVNTAGFNIIIAQPLLHSSVAGDSAKDGGLTKLGGGTLTLAGGYSYTGPNIILGGTLSLNSADGIPASSGDLVISNAMLTLDASSGNSMPAGNVVLDAGAVLNLTNTMSANAVSGAGNLEVRSNTIVDLVYGAVGGNPTVAPISVAGSVSITGANNVINLSGSGFVVGQFPLIQYGSGSLASISGLTLGALPPGVNAVLVNDTAKQSVDLNITLLAQNLTWYGTNNVWDINTTYNWNGASAKYLEYGASPNVHGDIVSFDDTLDNQEYTNVNLSTMLHPSQFTLNGTLPYIFTGAGSIAGSGSVIINGSGSLTLVTANSYTGGTVVNAGTLVVSNDNELGASSGVLTLNGGTVQYASSTAGARPVSLTAASVADIQPGVIAQWSGPVTGGGNLTLPDLGTLVLSSTGGSALGNLDMNNGQLNVTAGTVTVTDASGSQTMVENNSAIVVSGGTLNIVDGGSGWFPIGITTGATGMVMVAGGTINVYDHWGTEVGNNSGSGVLTINSGAFVNNDIGGVGLLIADSASPGGTINLNGGTLIANSISAGAGAGGNFYFNGGTLEPTNNNTGFWNNSTKVRASIRNGPAVVNTAAFNITIGQQLLHSTVSGDNAVDGGFTKLGSGDLTLSGTNAYTGNTRINGGTLELAQSVATLATNSTVTIASGARLQLDNAAVTNVVTSLVENGITNAAGLYDSTNGAGYITGSGYLQVLSGPLGPTGPAHLTSSFNAGVLSLSWPGGQGWRLQMETNRLFVGLSTNWVYLTDGAASSTNITADSAKPTVFYRLTYP